MIDLFRNLRYTDKGKFTPVIIQLSGEKITISPLFDQHVIM